MIDPEDVKNVVLDTADQSLIASVLNAVISNPQARAALVRELIAGGWCSPSACVVRRLDNNELVSLHDNALLAAAKVRQMRDRNPTRLYGISHWKGQTE